MTAMLQLGRAAAGWAARRPLTIALAAVVLAVGVATLALRVQSGVGRAATVRALATGFEAVVGAGRPWTLVTHVLVSGSALQLVVALVAIVLLLGAVEPRAGSRTLLAGTILAVLTGSSAALGVQALGRALDWRLTDAGIGIRVHDPLTAAVAGALVGSAFLGPAGRRRVRVPTLLACLLALVYLGQPDDLYRLATALSALLIGALLHRRRPAEPERWIVSREHETRVLVAGSVALVALGPIVSLLGPHRHSLAAPLTTLLSDSAMHVGRNECSIWRVSTECLLQESARPHLSLGLALSSVLPWLLLLVIALGLLRAMRMAVWLGAACNAAVVCLSLFYWAVPGRDPDAAAAAVQRGDVLDGAASGAATAEVVVQLVAVVAIHAAAAIALVATRRAFPLQVGRRAAAAYVVVVAGTAAVLGLGYLVVVLSVRGAFAPPPTLAQALLDMPERFLPPSILAATPVDFEPASPLGAAVHVGIAPLCTAVVIGATAVVLRRGRRAPSPLPRERVVAMLERGGDSLSWMATWPGMRHWTDAATGAGVAYRLEGSVAIALGAPIGDAALVSSIGGHRAAEGASGVLARFATFADAHGWTPVAYSVPAELGERFVAMGWSTIDVGVEGVIPLAEWSTSGKRRQDLRTASNRAAREGIEASWSTWSDLDEAAREQVRAISAGWVGDRSLPEMGFTLGGLAELRDEHVLLGIAVARDGAVQAVTSWLPVWRDGVLVGRTLDVMRRSAAAMPGVMEMLIARSAERFRQEGLELLSLSAAPLAQPEGAARDDGAADDRALLRRALTLLAERLEAVYGFGSLLAFKRKFAPEERQLVLAYPDPVALPAIAIALAQSYLPGISAAQAVAVLRSPGRDATRRVAHVGAQR